jgi:transcriptional regulator with XRE-family HTH domain
VGDETLGQRIRRARLERGLTLAQVAGEDFSRAFLNQVEMGRSQPSTRVLRVIASRLATPIDYLVVGSSRLIDLERAVERARLALDQGEVEEARAVLEEVRLPPP